MVFQPSRYLLQVILLIRSRIPNTFLTYMTNGLSPKHSRGSPTDCLVYIKYCTRHLTYIISCNPSNKPLRSEARKVKQLTNKWGRSLGNVNLPNHIRNNSLPKKGNVTGKWWGQSRSIEIHSWSIEIPVFPSHCLSCGHFLTYQKVPADHKREK